MRGEVLVLLISFIVQAKSQDIIISGYEISNCVEYVLAPGLKNINQFNQILCIECKPGYIVSKNFNKCLEFRLQLSMLSYGNCKRLAQNGLCAEAINGIELLPDNQFSFQVQSKFQDRCSIISYDYNSCLYPRFGYILDINSGKLRKDIEKTFCALYDSIQNYCIEFHNRFIRYLKTNQGVYLSEHFKNFDKIDLTRSCSYNIQCVKGYLNLSVITRIQQWREFQLTQGCIKGKEDLISNQLILEYDYSFTNKIENCKDQILTNFCQQCFPGYALKENNSQCQLVALNCEQYEIINKKNICTKCQPFYRLYFQKCKYMKGCEKISKKDPNICIACNLKSILKNGECIPLQNESNSQIEIKDDDQEQNKKQRNLKDILIDQYSSFIDEEKQLDQNQQEVIDNQQNDTDKEIIEKLKQVEQNKVKCSANGESSCIKCKDFDTYYFSQKESRCIKRIYSFNCLEKVFNQDICIDFKCKNDYSLNLALFPHLDFKNKETIEYFQEFIQNSFKNDYFMSDQEVDDLKERYFKMGMQKLNYSYCEINPQNKTLCNQIDPISNTCKTCYEEFQLVIDQSRSEQKRFYSFQCVNQFPLKQNKQINHCIELDYLESTCLNCSTGFYFNSNTNQCEQNIPNCIIHNINFTCFLCLNGYKLTPNGQCEPICQTNVPGVLGRFYSEQVFNNGKIQCIQTEIACAQFLENECIECFEGYVLDISNNNSCILDIDFHDCKQIDKISNNEDKEDLQYNYFYDGKKCIACNQGYTLYQGRCYCQKQKCLRAYHCDKKYCNKRYSSIFSTQLSTKDYQYVVKQDEYYEIKECELENCKICQDEKICLTCAIGYFFNNNEGKCIEFQTDQRILQPQMFEPAKDGCLIPEENSGKCKKCKNDYFIMIDFQCYDECPKGYQILTFNQTGRICYSCPINCLYCTIEINKFLLGQGVYCNGCTSDYYYNKQLGECRKTCAYYLQQNVCTETCSPNFVNNRQCVAKCPYFYIQEEGQQKRCIDKCEDNQFKYDDDPQFCSDWCEKGYAVDQEKKLCLKCKAENCSICSLHSLDECIQCEQNHIYYNGKCLAVCPNKLIEEDIKKCSNYTIINYCLEGDHFKCQQCAPTFILNQEFQCQCPEGSYYNLQTFKCEECQEGCLKCSLNLGCLQCAQNYYLHDMSFQNVFYRVCVKKCPPGFFYDKMGYITQNDQIYENKLCSKCSQLGCIRCNEKGCLECNSQYELDQDTKYFKDGSFDNNQIQQPSKCVCRESYALENDICKFKCYSQNTMVDSRRDCCTTHKCDVCSLKQTICEKCNIDAPYLFLNTCLTECPDGSFAEEEEKKCQKCSALCLTCNSKQCLSCVLPPNLALNDGTCRCIQDMVFFENNCYLDCPRFTKLSLSKNICEPYCNDLNSYPVFSEFGVFERCETDLGQPDSKFCSQNLNHLNKLIIFNVEDYGIQSYEKQVTKINIIVTISQTPKDCYIFRLRGIDSEDQFPLVANINNSYINLFYYKFNLVSEIPISQLKDKNVVSCNKYYCNLFFEIYLKNVLQQVIKLKVNYNAKIIAIEGVQDNNLLLNTKQTVIEVGEIAKEQILPSIHYLECGNISICDYKSILTQPFVPVHITITTSLHYGSTDNTLFTVYPLSLYIQLPDKSNLPINDFYFENSFPSSIKLIIYFNEVSQGQLIVVLRAYNQKYLLKSLDNYNKENKEYKYISQSIAIEVVEKIIQKEIEGNKEGSTQQINTGSEYELLLYFNTIVSTIVILIIFYQCCKKFKFKKKEEEDEDFFKMNTEEKNQSVSIELS